MSRFFAILIIMASVAAASPDAAEAGWRPLFNGSDLSGWDTYLGPPPKELEVPGLTRDEKGNYQQPIGLNRDPLHVFAIERTEDGPVIHISGQGYGVMTTQRTYKNYHLRLQVRWGEKRWARRAELPRDSGLLYHCTGEQGAMSRYWPRSVEFQIQERDFGDLYPLGTRITAKASKHEVGGKILYVYDPLGEPIVFERILPDGNFRCHHLEDAEKPHGDWNTIELVCLGDQSIHIVNGRVVMRLTNARSLSGGASQPLVEGQISLQTECAEVFYRNIEIRSIEKIPSEYAEAAP